MANKNYGFQSYLKQIREVPLLTVEKEKQLAELCAKGNEAARNQLVAANLRLVLMAAKHYTQNSSLSFDDLVQEGNMGLIRATQDFDPSKGFRFSTYAMHWIKQSISRAILNHSRTIRIPVHILELQTKYKRAQSDLRNELSRSATTEEIAERLCVEVKKVQEIENLIKDPVSFSTPLNDEDEGTIEDLVADTSIEDPDERIDNEALSKKLSVALAGLSDREKEVIAARFGLGNKRPKTLEEIGEKLGVSKERVRQIEEKALIKLRNPIRTGKLKEFLA